VELSGKNSITHQITLPLGTLRLLDECGKDPDVQRAYIRKTLNKTGWFRKHHPCFYAIGGGFRSIARLHMKTQRYPLSLVHGYEAGAEELFPFLSHLLSLKEKQLSALEGLSPRRLPGLIPSVVVLEEALRATGARSVVFSSAGIREGLLYDLLPEAEHEQDALTASLHNLIGHNGTLDSPYARTLFAWQEPLFAMESGVQRRLRRAVCQLNEIALAVSPEFRGAWAFEHIIRSSLYGITHRERVMLALALYYRYRRRFTLGRTLPGLLEKHDQLWAQLAGQSADLAFMLSAGTSELLEQVRVHVAAEDGIQLSGAAEPLSMIPAAAEKRLEGLGRTFKAFSSAAR
jgi:exopolyphosphatase/guanosine-5'-triphosphate,3'-diphosphate pyrophosphatase